MQIVTRLCALEVSLKRDYFGWRIKFPPSSRLSVFRRPDRSPDPVRVQRNPTGVLRGTESSLSLLMCLQAELRAAGSTGDGAEQEAAARRFDRRFAALRLHPVFEPGEEPQLVQELQADQQQQQQRLLGAS